MSLNRKLQLKGEVRVSLPDKLPTAVKHAWEMFARDASAVLQTPAVITESNESDIVVRWATEADRCPEWSEAFAYRYHYHKQSKHPQLHIVANDELGLVYGLLHLSEHYFGVDPFWYWADLPIRQQESVWLDGINFDSSQPKVRFRGWFVNDEVCLIGWTEQYPPPKEVWYPVFEALLRCGGNMVLPGTDLPKHGVHIPLAQEMGLWVTHHHAEPLGAEMFLRAYPGRKASYLENPDLFEKLWMDAIHKQKDGKVLWVLSFRGQGDTPFWEHDPQFDTPEKRGEMISHAIKKQYEMILSEVENAVCCTALYGEIAELYKAGHIHVPDSVIKVWADNGYGKMVSRRQGLENYRIPSLPDDSDEGRNGVYYHVTFHDLQASNHLTMLPVHPALIQNELHSIAESGALDYLLVNSGNIRPHLYPLEMLRVFWRTGTIAYKEVLKDLIKRLYDSNIDDIMKLYLDYYEHVIAYGPNEDDKAGDEFYHHPARIIIGHWLQGKGEVPEEALIWATGDVPFSEQISYFMEKCSGAIQGWEEWLTKYDMVAENLSEELKVRLQDQLRFHVELHLSGCKGLEDLCNAYVNFHQRKFPQAFVSASQSLWNFQTSLDAMDKSEHGKWKHFFRADWLTNVKNTLYNVDTLRRFIRMHGDNPDFFLWYKAYIMPETEKHIYLENTHRNPLSDNELAKMLQEKFNEN
ncbi:glycosyl hydrolase 115 family protein [Aquibacillus kalidii]|uniref:glycosyl hydrolase 115 family protein n=1 Tax=Aquibacillus kalidii TaxID=2762597 RepID=UPI001F46DCD6|nr:glycosyl hydrolase 115 family protein [Aquibacillus kalidii]